MVTHGYTDIIHNQCFTPTWPPAPWAVASGAPRSCRRCTPQASAGQVVWVVNWPDGHGRGETHGRWKDTCIN